MGFELQYSFRAKMSMQNIIGQHEMMNTNMQAVKLAGVTACSGLSEASEQGIKAFQDYSWRYVLVPGRGHRQQGEGNLELSRGCQSRGHTLNQVWVLAPQAVFGREARLLEIKFCAESLLTVSET